MRRLTALALVGLMAIAGCTDKSKDNNTDKDRATTTTARDTEPAAPDDVRSVLVGMGLADESLSDERIDCIKANVPDDVFTPNSSALDDAKIAAVAKAAENCSTPEEKEAFIGSAEQLFGSREIAECYALMVQNLTDAQIATYIRYDTSDDQPLDEGTAKAMLDYITGCGFSYRQALIATAEAQGSDTETATCIADGLLKPFGGELGYFRASLHEGSRQQFAEAQAAAAETCGTLPK